MDRFGSRGARQLDAALEGGATQPGVAPLVDLAAELRGMGAALPTHSAPQDGREQLRTAVLAQATSRRRGGSVARVRGATFVAAGVAGAGLVVAGAASGSNPAALVVDAARELPRLAGQAAPVASVSIEGEVVASRDGGRTFELRTGSDTITVEAPKEARTVTEAGTPVAAVEIEQGSTVRVTAERKPDAGAVTAKTIEVLPTALPAANARPGQASGAEPPATPTPSKDARPVLATAAPRPGNTPKPAATAVAANETAAIGAAPVLPTRTPTPTATPSPTPKAVATLAPSANETHSIGSEGDVASAGKDR